MGLMSDQVPCCHSVVRGFRHGGAKSWTNGFDSDHRSLIDLFCEIVGGRPVGAHGLPGRVMLANS